MEVDFVGDGSSFIPLVFEPIYNLDQQAMLLDSWQEWDAFAGGAAKWWSTRPIPGVCAFNCMDLSAFCVKCYREAVQSVV